MSSKPAKLTEATLLDACRSYAESSSHFVDTGLATERREVSDYYFGRRPFPLREGGSKFVSQDVYLSVEAMKAEVVETFGAGSRIVTFSPQNDDDAALAKQATALCEVAVFRQNPGLCIFQDVVHDGLTNRVGIAKVYWDKREAVEDYTFSNVTEAQATALLQNPSVRLTGKPVVSVGPDGTASISGEFEEVTDTSQVVIAPIPPEEFIIHGRTTSLDRARYCAHRYRTTRGELVEDGYDTKLVYSMAGGDDLALNDMEKLQREEGTTFYLEEDDSADEAGRMVTVYESYIRIDMDGSGRQRLWKVVHCGDTILDKQRVSSHPFCTYIPQPIPHTFYGNNFAQRTIQHANVKTTLTRAIIEQAVDATNPRWQVARGGVPNPRELLDNRRGGVVNVRSVTDSIAPLPSAPINPMVLQTISGIDQDREDVTSISRLSQGLDKKALSHQNSAGLVEKLTDNSQTRTKVIARLFAMQFVSQLYLKVYQLIIENETQERIIDIAGSFVPCTPSQWLTRRDVEVDMTLGYGDRDTRVEELLTLDKLLSQQGFARMYDEPQRYALMKDAMDIKGLKGTGNYLVDPKTLGPKEPDPQALAVVDELKAKAESLRGSLALRQQQIAAQEQRKDGEFAFKKVTHSDDMEIKRADTARKAAEAEDRRDIALAELELAVEVAMQADPANLKGTAIVSPN